VVQGPRAPVALRTRGGLVAHATAPDVEARGGTVRPQPPQPAVAARRVGEVTVPASRRPVTHRAVVALAPELPGVLRDHRVATPPGAAVAAGEDGPGAGARELRETGRGVAAGAVPLGVAAVRIDVAALTAAPRHPELEVERGGRRLPPIGEGPRARGAAPTRMAPRAAHPAVGTVAESASWFRA